MPRHLHAEFEAAVEAAHAERARLVRAFFARLVDSLRGPRGPEGSAPSPWLTPTPTR